MSHDDRAYVSVVALFAAVLYLALIVAVFGLIALGANIDVIADPRIGPLVGPVMVGACVITLLILLVWTAVQEPPRRHPVSPVVAVGVGLACFLVYIVAGVVSGAVGDPRDALLYVLFGLEQIGSVFSLSIGVLACVVTLLFQAVLAGRFRDRGRPRWPWEKDSEE